MTRSLLLSVALALGASSAAPSAAPAQDMPLSQILIDGEGWRKVEAPGAKPKPTGIEPPTASGTYVPTHLAYSPDRSTAFYLSEGAKFIAAAQVAADGKPLAPGAPYAPLRRKRGAKSLAVGGLAVDRDGRIYAATEVGVQVFDPTGRLCGVMAAPPGRAELLTFEGDKLTLWVGETKYARKLNTTEAK
jgi:sugar lactone lactonase YvrE